MAPRALETLFVDTSYIVALVNTRDQYHQKALQLTEIFNRNRLVTSEGVLLEIAGAFSAKFKKAAIDIIESFISSDNIVIIPMSPDLFSLSFNLYKKYADKEWSLVDCMSFLIMREMKVHSALTADAHFKQAGFDSLLV
jgi:predicted nucleic acid-binding protein